MSHTRNRITAVAVLALAALAPAHAQTPAPQPTTGAQFQCDDGGKLFLSFDTQDEHILATVWVRGARYQLTNMPAIPGLARIVWSDGERSLTWNPGVQLMWMGDQTHLMCGRGGGHRH